MAGALDQFDPYNDDVQYVADLGLIAPKPPLRIANPIYREVVVRVLATNVEYKVVADPRCFVLDDKPIRPPSHRPPRPAAAA